MLHPTAYHFMHKIAINIRVAFVWPIVAFTSSMSVCCWILYIFGFSPKKSIQSNNERNLHKYLICSLVQSIIYFYDNSLSLFLSLYTSFPYYPYSSSSSSSSRLLLALIHFTKQNLNVVIFV